MTGFVRGGAGALLVGALASVALAAPASAQQQPTAQRAAPRHGSAVRPGGGAAMCEVLTAADLEAHGLAPERTTPSTDVQDNGASAYCVYAGMSGAMGGIELDVFFPAGPDPKQTEATANADISGKLEAAGLTGADDSQIGLGVRSGGPPFSTITVRRRDLVFALSIPPGPKAREQLLALAHLVLLRTGR